MTSEPRCTMWSAILTILSTCGRCKQTDDWMNCFARLQFNQWKTRTNNFNTSKAQERWQTEAKFSDY